MNEDMPSQVYPHFFIYCKSSLIYLLHKKIIIFVRKD